MNEATASIARDPSTESGVQLDLIQNVAVNISVEVGGRR